MGPELQHFARRVPSSDAAKEVSDYVAEYLVRLDAGEPPFLEEFIRGVPEHLQEDLFVELDRALANREPENEEEDHVPRTEVVVTPTGARWIRVLAFLAPAPFRRQVVGEILAEREEMDLDSASALSITAVSVRELANAISQHAPLRPLPEKGSAPSAAGSRPVAWAWFFWRVSGPLLLSARLAGNTLLGWLGGLALVFAFATLINIVRKKPLIWTEKESRLSNALLGGTFIALVVTFLSGLVAVPLLALAAAFSFGWLGAFAVECVVFLALLGLCIVTGSGWAPQPWYPKRLVRV